MEKDTKNHLADSGSGECEYDFGHADFTGDFDKLPPHIQEVANQIHEAAFGNQETVG